MKNLTNGKYDTNDTGSIAILLNALVQPAPVVAAPVAPVVPCCSSVNISVYLFNEYLSLRGPVLWWPTAPTDRARAPAGRAVTGRVGAQGTLGLPNRPPPSAWGARPAGREDPVR